MKLFSNKKYLNFIPNIKENKTQRFTSIILTLIALTIFGIFTINPTLSTIAKLNKELSDLEVLNEKLEQKISDISSLQKAYNRLQDDMQTVFLSIPETPSAPLLTGEIHTLAKESNLNISQIKSENVELVRKRVPEESFYSFEFSIVGEGFYDNIINLTEKMKNMQRIVAIEGVYISDLQGDGGSLEFNIQGTAYYKK